MSVSWSHSLIFFLVFAITVLPVNWVKSERQTEMIGVIRDNWINPNRFVGEEMMQSRKRRGDPDKFTPGR